MVSPGASVDVSEEQEDEDVSGTRRSLVEVVRSQWADFRSDGYTFQPNGYFIGCWEWSLCLTVLYSSFFGPLSMVFPETRWSGCLVLDGVISAFWMLDVCVIKHLTSFKEYGYDIMDVRKISRRYLRGSFRIDLLSSFPFTLLVAASGRDYADIGSPWSAVQGFTLLRIVRLIKRTSRLTGRWSKLVMIGQMIYILLLLAHLCGLIWYSVSIRPLERSLTDDTMPPPGFEWWWLEDSAYSVAVRYVCSLYWALSVMTSLKSINAHESRQCFYHTDVMVPNPLLERCITIAVYVVGALTIAVIYGQVFQFVQSLGEQNLRYRKRMDEIQEFVRFNNLTSEVPCAPATAHAAASLAILSQGWAAAARTLAPDWSAGSVPARTTPGWRGGRVCPVMLTRRSSAASAPHTTRCPCVPQKLTSCAPNADLVYQKRSQLSKKILSYVDFAFSVTNGLDVDELASSLPPNLQLEIQLQMNKKMVEQVKLFVGFPKVFFQELVMKLTPWICVSGDYVFYEVWPVAGPRLELAHVSPDELLMSSPLITAHQLVDCRRPGAGRDRRPDVLSEAWDGPGDQGE